MILAIILSVLVVFAENAAENPLMPLAALCKADVVQKGFNSGRSSTSFSSPIKSTICGNADEYAVVAVTYYASPNITVSVVLFCEWKSNPGLPDRFFPTSSARGMSK